MALERVLVVNVGSSSFKWSSLDAEGGQLAGASEPWTPSLGAAGTQVEQALRTAGRPSAIGHRIVHGGPAFTGPVRLDVAVRAKLEELRVLAARHMAPALACLDACTRLLPEVPQICAFDTAFHATLNDAARTYAVPAAWRDALALRRYGFHGLSVAWSVRRTTELLGALPPRIVVCHLGSGCSVTAVRDGRSVDTSMGYTPLDGVVMATRAGQLDPGAVLAIAEHLGTGRTDVEGRLESDGPGAGRHRGPRRSSSGANEAMRSPRRRMPSTPRTAPGGGCRQRSPRWAGRPGLHRRRRRAPVHPGDLCGGLASSAWRSIARATTRPATATSISPSQARRRACCASRPGKIWRSSPRCTDSLIDDRTRPRAKRLHRGRV
jgi:hypothetical protein